MSQKRSWWPRDLPLIAVCIPIVLVALALYGWEQQLFSERQIGFVIADTDEGLLIDSVRPSGPASRSGLQAGDLIRSVQGIPVESMLDYDPAITSQPRGSLTLFVVERNGQRVDVGVEPGMPFPLFSFSATALTVLAYLIIGPLALRRRPGYLRSRLLFLLSMAIALEIALPGVHTWIDLWAGIGVLLSGIQLGLEFHLASVIPERQRWLDRRPWVIPAYYVFGLGLGLTIAGGFFLGFFGKEWILPWSTDSLYWFYLTIVSPGWAAGVLFLLTRQALVYPERQGRQQAALVALGVLPWAIVLFLSEAGWLSDWVAFRWQDLVWNLALLCYPLAVLLLLFQEATTQERILRELTHRVHNAGSIVEVSRLVSDDLNRAFHPQGTHVFYRKRSTGDLALGHSSGPHLAEEILPPDSSLLRLVGAAGRAVTYPDDLAGLDAQDADWLDQLGAHLIVPLTRRGHDMLGLLILGPKKSEERYTDHDRNLLRALTHQISLVYENARLEERVSDSQELEAEQLSQATSGIERLAECPQCGYCGSDRTPRCPHDATPLQSKVSLERTIEGRYRLDERLGRGGMGAIYRARDLRLDREVAIKVLLGDFASGEARRRFETEGRLTARLQHPNVVTLHDFGTTLTGAAYLVLEFLEGETLAERLRRVGRLPVDTVIRLFSQICSGVQLAHQQQVIHRDLKPSNLLLTVDDEGEDTVKILDFGVARALEDVPPPTASTTPGMLVGTFRYMSPEQLRGEDVDPRSDLFAIAVLVVECLTATPPFSGEGPPKLLHSIQQGLDPSLDSNLSQEAWKVLRRGLDYDPSRRYASVAELWQDLLPALRAMEPRKTRASRGHPDKETR